MSKHKQHPEFYIAFYVGLKPKDLIERGFKKASVYNYFRRYNKEVKSSFELLLKSTQPIV